MRRYLNLGVFFSGFACLAVEMSASRLLGNYFGSSNLVWASIIGLILIYLTLGYWLGGKLADKHPHIEYFFTLLAWAALLIGIVPLISRPILQFASQAFDQMNIAPLLGSFCSVLVLFSAPVILLGSVSPFAIRLALNNKIHAGTEAGRIYAISTIGSFIGTFLPVLVLIPAIGTYRTFVFISFLLLFISLYGLWKTINFKSALRKLWMPVLLAILTVFGLIGVDKTTAGLVYETESAYNYIQVLELDGYRYLRLNEGQGIHSIYHPDNIIYHGAWDMVSAATFLLPSSCDLDQVQEIAIIGLAAGTSARQAFAIFPQVNIDGFEIDPKIIQVGLTYFSMHNDNLHVINQDGRWGLDKSNKTYDVISIDAFHPPYIPWHLTTLEFFNEVKAHLNQKGVLVLNVVRIMDDQRLLSSLFKTIQQVFPSVIISNLPGSFNSIIFASLQPISIIEAAKNYECLVNKNNTPQLLLDALSTALINIQPEPSGGIIFTDDLAPVEWLTNQMIANFVITGKAETLQ